MAPASDPPDTSLAATAQARGEAFKHAFAACLQLPFVGRMAGEMFAEPAAVQKLLLETLSAMQPVPERHNDNVKVILEKILRRQTDRIDSYLGPRDALPRVGFYCPSRAYRHTFGDSDTRLRQRGIRVAKLFREYVDDEYEKSEGAFYAGYDIPLRFRNIDFLFMATLADFPKGLNFSQYLFVHDIFDSPLGDEAEFRRLARQCTGFFMPSTLGVESMQRVFAPIARPDDPAAGGKRYVIIRGGYPRLDQNISYFNEHAADEKTIIYAPTLPLKEFVGYVSVPKWAEGIVETLLDRFPDYRLIFRPHPHSHDEPAVRAIISRFTPHPRFEADMKGTDYMPNYSRAALMVSDTSGTAYTYAFTTGRPVVFFAPNDAEAKALNPGVRYFEFRENVGVVVQDLEGLATGVATALANRDAFRERTFRLRDSVVFNVGRSCEYFTSIFDQLISGTDIPGAIYFRADPP